MKDHTTGVMSQQSCWNRANHCKKWHQNEKKSQDIFRYSETSRFQWVGIYEHIPDTPAPSILVCAGWRALSIEVTLLTLNLGLASEYFSSRYVFKTLNDYNMAGSWKEQIELIFLKIMLRFTYILHFNHLSGSFKSPNFIRVMDILILIPCYRFTKRNQYNNSTQCNVSLLERARMLDLYTQRVSILLKLFAYTGWVQRVYKSLSAHRVFIF